MEMSQERLMKKHLPTSVISGVVSAGVISLLMIFCTTSQNCREDADYGGGEGRRAWKRSCD
jgi:hypothetical protein